MTNKVVTYFRKSGLKLLLWFLILTSVAIFAFLTYGYKIASQHVTYLPKIRQDDLESFSSGVTRFELKRPWYVLLVDENGRVTIETNDGRNIMSGLTYYAAYDSLFERWGLNNISVKLSTDSTISITGEGPVGIQIDLLLTVHSVEPKIDINVNTHYRKNTIIHRETLVAAFDIPVSTVYRKNGKVDVNSFESEYWLHREGVRFGSNDRSALIYHTPLASSIQIDSKRNLAFINLEYYLDHPYINFPYNAEGGVNWVDQSAATYSSGSEKNSQFSIYIGSIPAIAPRLMSVPNGYLAGYVFTEHADGANLRTNRAVYFGAEDILNIDSAVGGFAGHKIPVSKSVLYINPNGTTISEDAQWLDYLDQINRIGIYDIGLHTPEELNSNRITLEESIKFFRDRYNTTTWIDHGFYNGKINRECFVCDGLNPYSEYYAADLWEKYNTRFFWNPAVESRPMGHLIKEICKFRFGNASVELWRRLFSPNELKEMSFFPAFIKLVKRYPIQYELNSFQPIKGETYPTPLFWQHFTRTRHFYSWVTDYAKAYKNLSASDVENEKKLLNHLINEWGVFIHHGYFPRIIPGLDVLSENNGKIIIDPYFDKILGIMANMRDEGDLYITTIRDLLNYWILIENVSFKYFPDGVIYIYNNNDKPIKGLSLAVHALGVRVNGNIPKFRRVADDIIFWFDIKASDHVILKIKH